LGTIPINTPIERGLKLWDKSNLLKDPGCFRRLADRLIYLIILILDITYIMHVLSRFMHQPLKNNFSNTNFKLRVYFDLDWTGCPLKSKDELFLYDKIR
jgi:hypothetical protein